MKEIICACCLLMVLSLGIFCVGIVGNTTAEARKPIKITKLGEGEDGYSDFYEISTGDPNKRCFAVLMVTPLGVGADMECF